jgi:predicted Rossmann fold nucleotide-binding protein DprA/Smf involved in DNA uptake
MALEQGREVYALPGRVSDALSDGCNRLIRQGAGPATCPQDILEYFFGPGGEEAGERERKAVKREPEPSCKIEVEQTSAEDENRTDTCPLIIDQQHAEQQEGDWEETGLKNRNPLRAWQQEEDWTDADPQEERTMEQIIPESLDRRILRLLSTEDEKHIERILEEVSGPDLFSDSVKSEAPISLPELVSCLMRLKIGGRVEESSTGYYRKR